MCTVTLVPLDIKNKSFVLTSNRDEGVHRKAVAPAFYREYGVKLLYPRDEESGGSWIGLSENSRLICLLNGGFEEHVRQESYRVSRGVVLKELLVGGDFEQAVHNYDLNDIEPFTIIAVDWADQLKFWELVWDGKSKHFTELSHKAQIWSSSPLYNSKMKSLRESWFSIFFQTRKLTAKNLWEFHHNAGMGDKNIDVIMDRGFVKTQSITQVENTGKLANMRFENLANNRDAITPFKMR